MNNFYVYQASVSNTVVYIGIGQGTRLNHITSGVSSCYKANQAHFSGVAVTVEKVATGLSRSTALGIESGLISSKKPKWNTVKPLNLNTRCPSAIGEDEVLKAVKSSSSPVVCGEVLGISVDCVYSVMRRVGIKTTETGWSRRAFKLKNIDRACELRRKGMNLSQCAKLIGVSIQTIKNWTE